MKRISARTEIHDEKKNPEEIEIRIQFQRWNDV